VALDGSQLTMTASTISNPAFDGIDAFSSAVQILDSTVSGSNGPGIYLSRCSGTVEGSTLSRNKGTFGDGIELVTGSWSSVAACWTRTREQEWRCSPAPPARVRAR